MSEELQKPPVVDIDTLLQPIEGDNPSGESLRYSGVYDEIADARRADDGLAQGDWKTEPKSADFRRVIDLAFSALSTRSKDIQIAAWLAEALIDQHGFAGLRDGIKLISRLQESFWDTLHPVIDEGDMEGRANAVSWIEAQAGRAAMTVPITAAEGFSFTDWEESKKLEIPDNIDLLESDEQDRIRQAIAQAESDRRATGETWRRAKGQTRRRFYEELDFVLDECWSAINELDHVNEAFYDRNQMPGLSNLRKSVDSIHSQVKKLLEEKRAEEPDEIETTSGDISGEISGNGSASVGGSVRNRREALLRLAEIAAFFQKTEPHSPVAYLVQRAVKWGNMPLETWLQDVIKDENVLFQLRETLGIDSSAAGSSAADGSGEGW